jgi:hypothetical protein
MMRILEYTHRLEKNNTISKKSSSAIQRTKTNSEIFHIMKKGVECIEKWWKNVLNKRNYDDYVNKYNQNIRDRHFEGNKILYKMIKDKNEKNLLNKKRKLFWFLKFFNRKNNYNKNYNNKYNKKSHSNIKNVSPDKCKLNSFDFNSENDFCFNNNSKNNSKNNSNNKRNNLKILYKNNNKNNNNNLTLSNKLKKYFEDNEKIYHYNFRDISNMIQRNKSNDNINNNIHTIRALQKSKLNKILYYENGYDYENNSTNFKTSTKKKIIKVQLNIKIQTVKIIYLIIMILFIIIIILIINIQIITN